jgi:hypothetical protein
MNGTNRSTAFRVLVVLIIANAVLLLVGAAQSQGQNSSAGLVLLGAAATGITVTLAALAVMVGFSGGQASAAPVPAQDTGGMNRTQAQEMIELLKTVSERMLISDMAKRIAYRENDREALRRAIREDIDRRDYDAALILVSEMGRSYGYRLEAEQFREEIEAARAAELNSRITEAVAGLDRLINQHAWERARQEAAKIQRLFPDAIQVQGLDKRIDEALDEYKKQLQQEFLDAAQQEDTERAMETMKELDKYLTREEAAPFLDTARQVVKKKRDNLGLQFKLAFSDQDWKWAIKVGEQILAEFPNAQMAKEVRDLLPNLRQKAGVPEPTEAEAATETD